MGTFAAMLFNFFLKRRSREINGGEANNDAAANDGTARGDSKTHTSTEIQEMATSSRGDPNTHTPTDVQEMATLSGRDYEVFLSFRGSDTRTGFTDFLYTSLTDAGIRTYRYDEDLHYEEEFGPKFLHLIEMSKISIPIFSKDYASSSRCLNELVQMIECQKTRGQKIMPIFYDVAPSEVRYQTGNYEHAFYSHVNKRYDMETICKWREALRKVSLLNGWDLHGSSNRREGEFARTVTQEVFKELKEQVKLDFLVSVDHHVDEIMELIGARTSETRIVGIYGMGGIGKTTIAKIIYNQLSNNFEDWCFLSNIREISKLRGIEWLQNQLISDILKTKYYISSIDEGIKIIKDKLSNKRVLILLDDVGEKNHMDALVGKRDWFGKGSKLIITTRRKDVLDVPEVDSSYEISGMDPNQSLQLFSKHAFRRDYPLDEYIDQSKKAVDIASGLPLALEIIGSLLHRTPKEKWDVTLEKLENLPCDDIQSKLKISYDALNFQQKHIFLDIACLFIGYDKDILVHFWNEFKYPEEAMEFLQNMSLIKINEDNEVWMHDQLRDLGREIVRQKSNRKIVKQSRVWNPEEALDLLTSNEEKEEVEALRLKLDHKRQYCFTDEDFMRLSNIRFLAIDSSMGNFCAQGRLHRHKLPSNDLPTKFFQKNSGLLPQLQWLSWHNLPLIFDIKNFSLVNLVIVDLSRSEITDDWDGWSHMEVIKNLKVLNLTDCRCLKKTPDVSFHANLERLILRGCSKLIEIDRSICHLKHLACLDVRNCQNFWRLPDELGELATLEYLSLGNCGSLKRLPDSIGGCKSLIELDISGTSIEKLPDSIKNLKNLKVIKMTRSCISKIPDALWTMKMLEEIEAANNPLLHVEICNDIYMSPSLMILELMCAEIHAVPRLPKSLVSLRLCRLNMKTFPDLSNLINLKELYLSFTTLVYDVKFHELREDPFLGGIGKLYKLESLELHSDNVAILPPDISVLCQLKALELGCPNLRCLPGLPSCLSSLCLYYCKSVCSMDLSNLTKLSSLVILSSAISEIRGLDCLRNLQNLRISGLGQLDVLPDLSNLNKLRSLQVRICVNLVEIQGELPQSLEDLEIYFCGSLQQLPDLSSLKGLQHVAINDCMRLNMEAILGFTRRSPQVFGRSWR
ncbi:hypothetical protein BT93_H2538 [Corymbia citriodora subsp. variegata]|nr:hypothetical protein BT93_H2538 [Corymbia citriodora subsp. variegata]